MSFDAARATIETRFRDQWLVGSPAALRTPVGWDGHAFEPRRGDASVRLSIRDGEGFPKSAGAPGSNVVRRVGVVFVEVFTPGGEGSKVARDLIDHIRPIFEHWRDGNLLFRTMAVAGPIEDPPFYKLTATFPFELDTFNG